MVALAQRFLVILLSMIIPNKTHLQCVRHFLIPQTTPRRSFPIPSSLSLPLPPARRRTAANRLGRVVTRCSVRSLEFVEERDEGEVDLSEKGEVYRNTLALVECSMFASLTGLVYFLSNSLAIENYFGCFFSLPIVISSMRWGIPAGRKTMVATTMLLLVLSGPIKALTYLLRHGLAGFAMGALWRSGADWKLSVFLCTIVRALGAVGYVLISSFLIRENIFGLITINIHASLTFLFTASGIYAVPSMNAIYTLFTILVLLNSASFMFLMHILYAIFLSRLGMRASLRMPKWLEKAL